MRGVCMNGDCGHHGYVKDLGARVGGKVGMALAGAAVGGVKKDPLAVLLGGLAGLASGLCIDVSVLPSCDGCGEVLQILDESL